MDDKKYDPLKNKKLNKVEQKNVEYHVAGAALFDSLFASAVKQQGEISVESKKDGRSDIEPIVVNFITDVISKNREGKISRLLAKKFENVREDIVKSSNENKNVLPFQKANNQVFAEIRKREVIKHDPQDTVDFIRSFTKGQYLKWATHSWDNERNIAHVEWIVNCRKDFLELLSRYSNIPIGTILKIATFCFQYDFEEKSNRWSWHKIDIGWSSNFMVEHCKNSDNPFSVKIDRSYFANDKEL